MKLGFFDFEEDPLDNSIEYFLRHQLVTNEQIECYKKYLEFRSQDEVARETAIFDSIYEGWSIEEIKNQINRLKRLQKEKARGQKSEG